MRCAATLPWIDRTAEERAAAVAKLLIGVRSIQGKVAAHLMAMKAASMVGEDSSSRGTANEIAAERSAPVDDLADHTNKLTELLDQLGHKVKEEIKDPSKRDSPQVLFDVKLFLTVKDSVDKTKALIAAVGVALRE